MTYKTVTVQFVNEDEKAGKVRLRQKHYMFKVDARVKFSKFGYVIIPKSDGGYALGVISQKVLTKEQKQAHFKPTTWITRVLPIESSLRTAKNGYSGWRKIDDTPDYRRAKARMNWYLKYHADKLKKK